MLNLSDQFNMFLQCILPQHFVSRLAGWLADCRLPWLKNKLIKRFIKKYSVDLTSALRKQPEDYVSFNDFFIRQLDSRFRPIANGPQDIVSPIDGIIAQIGRINKALLLQAKAHYFDLTTLLGNEASLAERFYDGEFATLYLAPHNYHRVHMPITGKLVKTIYVPGRLFSVNRMTSELIPNLYSRNERLICLFDTAAGPLAIIMIGAMIVGRMQTVWMAQPIKHQQIKINIDEAPTVLQKGDELGYFCLGSTVILLFGKNKISWEPNLKAGSSLEVGKLLGSLRATLSLP